MSVRGGAEKCAAQIANALVANNKVFLVSVLLKNGSNIFTLSKHVKFTCLMESVKRKLSIGVFFKSIFKLRKFIKENNIETVIVVGVGLNLIACLATTYLDVKLISSEQRNVFAKDHVVRGIINRVVAALWFEKIVCLTNRDCEAYREKYRVKRKKLSYIYNYIDESWLNNGYDSSSRKIITVANLIPVKGIEYLIKVAEMVFSEIKDWQWDVYGDGDTEYREWLQNKIEQKGLNKHVFLKGKCDNLKNIYNKYSIFVLTSISEGMPLVLLEAKANCLPVVSFDCLTGPAEIIENNISGYLIEPYDVKNMAKMIISLVNNENKRKQFSMEAKNNIHLFTQKRYVEQWNKVVG